MLYSKLTGGFYTHDIHTNIPEDAVEVSDAEYAMLLAGQGAGKTLKASHDGRPVLTEDLPSFQISRRWAAQRVLATAQRLMTAKASPYFFSSIDEACATVTGAQADLGAQFTELRDRVKAAAKDAILNMGEGDTIPSEYLTSAVAAIQELIEGHEIKESDNG